jgi:hypothetical protein
MSKILDVITEKALAADERRARVMALLDGPVGPEELNEADQHGQSALRHAILKKWEDAAIRMIQLGADPNGKCARGFVHLRAAGSQRRVVEALLEAGARTTADLGEVYSAVLAGDLGLLQRYVGHGVRFSLDTKLGGVSPAEALSMAGMMVELPEQLPEVVGFMCEHGLDASALAAKAIEDRSWGVLRALAASNQGGVTEQTLGELEAADAAAKQAELEAARAASPLRSCIAPFDVALIHGQVISEGGSEGLCERLVEILSDVETPAVYLSSAIDADDPTSLERGAIFVGIPLMTFDDADAPPAGLTAAELMERADDAKERYDELREELQRWLRRFDCRTERVGTYLACTGPLANAILARGEWTTSGADQDGAIVAHHWMTQDVSGAVVGSEIAASSASSDAWAKVDLKKAIKGMKKDERVYLVYRYD